jgi:hypothetical protein
MPANDNDKKTPSDVQERKPQPSKKLTVTWFKAEVSLTHPGMGHISSYQLGNKQMNGDKRFTWLPGAPYLESAPDRDGLVAIVPIFGLMFQVQT